MSSVVAQLLQSLAADRSDELAQTLRAEPEATRQAVAVAIPLLLEALARNASRPDGADSLHQALATDHDGSLLDNLSGFLGRPDLRDGNGILEHVLGDQREAVERGVAKSSGLDLARVGQLLAVIAPIVMSALGRRQREADLDQGGLADWLRQERNETDEAAPELTGLGRLLDRNGDGSVGDDLMGLGAGLLRRVLASG